MHVMVSPDGYRVERILVQKSLSRPARGMLRVKHVSYFVADCTSVAGVAQHVDLASQVPKHVRGTVPSQPILRKRVMADKGADPHRAPRRQLCERPGGQRPGHQPR